LLAEQVPAEDGLGRLRGALGGRAGRGEGGGRGLREVGGGAVEGDEVDVAGGGLRGRRRLGDGGDGVGVVGAVAQGDEHALVLLLHELLDGGLQVVDADRARVGGL